MIEICIMIEIFLAATGAQARSFKDFKLTGHLAVMATTGKQHKLPQMANLRVDAGAALGDLFLNQRGRSSPCQQ